MWKAWEPYMWAMAAKDTAQFIRDHILMGIVLGLVSTAVVWLVLKPVGDDALFQNAAMGIQLLIVGGIAASFGAYLTYWGIAPLKLRRQREQVEVIANQQMERLKAEVAILEEARKPRLSVTKQTNLVPGQSRTVRATLRIENLGTEEVRRCRVQIVDVAMIMESGKYYRSHEGQNYFLRWNNTNETSLDFHSQAVLDFLTTDGGHTPIHTVGTSLALAGPMCFVLELSAENVPAQRVAYEVSVSAYTTQNDKGQMVVWFDMPPKVEIDEVVLPEKEAFIYSGD